MNNGEIGEILVSTAAEFSGYVNDGDCKIVLDGKPFVKRVIWDTLTTTGICSCQGAKTHGEINAINVFPFETEEK